MNKMICLGLALALFAGVFVGCGKKKEEPRPGAKPETSGSAPTTSETEPDPVDTTLPPVSTQEVVLMPVAGASGYASVPMYVRDTPGDDGAAVTQLSPGQGFTVLAEQGDWWQIQQGEHTGWVRHSFCLVNLPDMIPSIVYDNTNTYSSLFITSGREIPGITGQQLYQAYDYNPRLGRDEYIMPVLYATAQKIYRAQREALAEGNSLKIYEAFRPYDTQMQVVNAVQALADSDEAVMAGLNTAPWEIHWFIATSVSNHQFGYAIDVSLVQVTEYEMASIGEQQYPRVTAYEEYAMPCQIHELSTAAVTFTVPVKANDKDAWRTATLADSMNDAAVMLQRYCTNAGLTPLASEWWHFNDLDAREAILQNPSNGRYVISNCYSQPV